MASFVSRIGMRGGFWTFLSAGSATAFTLILDAREASKGVWVGGGVNPLRLATLDASPFCCAKRGGMGFFVLRNFPRKWGNLDALPPYRLRFERSCAHIHSSWGGTGSPITYRKK